MCSDKQKYWIIAPFPFVEMQVSSHHISKNIIKRVWYVPFLLTCVFFFKVPYTSSHIQISFHWCWHQTEIFQFYKAQFQTHHSQCRPWKLRWPCWIHPRIHKILIWNPYRTWWVNLRFGLPNIRANPKSANLSCPSSPISKLFGFISLWNTK